MIKQIFVIILFSSLLLTACSKTKVMNFVGESDNWHVSYDVMLIDENSESTDFTIKYIGEDPIPQKINYSIEYVSGENDGNVNLNNGELKTSGHFCDGCAVIQKNEVMKVTISWNGKSETVNLKSK